MESVFNYDPEMRKEAASWLARTGPLRRLMVDRLLAERTSDGHWEGKLSSSALSTATAVTALSTFQRHGGVMDPKDPDRIERGIKWLTGHQNQDGGWGDTVRSHSNISTTLLVWSALNLATQKDDSLRRSLEHCESWLLQQCDSLAPESIRRTIEARYGIDRTFSIPILTMAAISGRLGETKQAWNHVRPLPFELAALPQSWFGALRLPVVSYALPALIAIGQVRHHQLPSRNPFARWIRHATRRRTLNTLERIQPENGGFLEATPLTSFVTMSLAAMDLTAHPVARKGIQFLRQSIRPDGSWPIDTNLATWCTTLSVQSLKGVEDIASIGWSHASRAQIRQWLLKQQYRTVHPYTLAAPGGWAWTDLPGGVPDADDTAGALLALEATSHIGPRETEAAGAAVQWLLNLRNDDGGIPTFCRGWGKLPFDRSSPDLTAHAIRAWSVWKDRVEPLLSLQATLAIESSLKYLSRVQKKDGSWIPLWFGNQDHPDETNPLYGTVRVLQALTTPALQSESSVPRMISSGCEWLLTRQDPDGGWSGADQGTVTIEETALAMDGLAGAFPFVTPSQRQQIFDSLKTGFDWLEKNLPAQGLPQPSPIGFYFARLWYYERLYPVIFATGALNRLHRLLVSLAKPDSSEE